MKTTTTKKDKKGLLRERPKRTALLLRSGTSLLSLPTEWVRTARTLRDPRGGLRACVARGNGNALPCANKDVSLDGTTAPSFKNEQPRATFQLPAEQEGQDGSFSISRGSLAPHDP